MFTILEFLVRGFIWALVVIFKILVLLVKAVFNIGQLYSYSHTCPYCGAQMHTSMAQQERCANCGSIAGRPPARRRNASRGRSVRQRSPQFNLTTGAAGPDDGARFTVAHCHHCNWSSKARNAEDLGVRHRENSGHLVIFE